MKYPHGIGREQMRYRIRNLEPQEAHIADPAAFYLPASASHSSGQPLYSQKISLRIRSRRRGEKRAIAATKIDLQRRLAAEDVLENKRGAIIRRKDFRRIRYRGRSDGHVE